MPPAKEPRLVEIQVDSQLTETIRQLHEVSSRIDERIKHLIEKQNGMADKLEKLSDKLSNTISENATRIAILEKADVDEIRDKLDDVDKKLAILEKQMNNGIRSDVDDMKDKVRALELSNEHNISFRTKGEARIDWWLNVVWKTMQIIGVAALSYYLSKK